MKKLNKYLIILASLLISGVMISQSTITGFNSAGHNAGNSTNDYYLGWLDSSIPLDFRTNNQKRMQIAKNGNITVMNQTFNNGGFVGIGEGSGFYNTGAYSKLHINGGNGSVNVNPYSGGFRTWMKYGTLVTANKDMMYMGIKNNLGLDHSEAVISWSDNTSGSIADYLVFKFTSSSPQSNPTSANRTNDGLEVARFAPSGNVGIGDFSNNGFGLNQDPTQKLDVDGTARLRQMPSNNPDVLITGVEQNAAGDYVMNYKDLSGDPDEYLGGDGNWYQVNNGADCDWESSGNDIFMGTPASCATGNVAIGQLPIANSRLSIAEVADDGQNQEFGEKIEVSGYESGVTYVKTGLYSEVKNYALKWNRALDGFARDGDNNVGVRGRAYYGYNNFAIRGQVGGYGSNYAIYGSSPNTPNDWAGYFSGKTFCSSGLWSGSDENLKQDITDISGAVATLQQIDCKTYNFRTEEYAQLNLPQGQHCGVIAQNLEEILPDAVTVVHQPEQYDEDGNLEYEAIDFKAVNYTELIPILIQATKEQQANIDEKDERIANLEAQMEEMYTMINQCCEMQGKSYQNNGEENDIKLDLDKNILKQNTPNPFDLDTTIEYYLAQGGKVTITITDARGQLVQTLTNETQARGTHQVQWQAQGIERGVYYYSLNINGEEMVKRMVKL